jgi:hypothetical protein
LNGDWFCAVFRAMPFWSVVRSQSQRERFAAEQLGLRGFETFLPMVQTKRASAPLFSGYSSAASSIAGGRSTAPSAFSAWSALAIVPQDALIERSTASRR